MCVCVWHNTGIKLKSRYGLKSYDSSSDHIVHSVEESLKALRCDSVDTVLIHRPDPLMDPSDVAAAFDGLRKGGLVRAFGVSNFTPAQCELLRASAADAVSINQVRFTPIGGERWVVMAMVVVAQLTFNDALVELCTQVQWSVLAPDVLFDGTIDHAFKHGIRVQAWSPLGTTMPTSHQQAGNTNSDNGPLTPLNTCCLL